MKTDIKNKSGETIGALQDVVINREGGVVGVVVDVSDFLSIGGERDVLLDWSAVTVEQNGDTLSITTDLDKDAIAKKQPYKVASL